MGERRTALVLGGGGITGIAWEVGVLAGLADAGVSLAGADLAKMYERQLEPPGPHEPVARMTRANLVRYGLALLRSRGRGTGFRRRTGELAGGRACGADAVPAGRPGARGAAGWARAAVAAERVAAVWTR